MRKKSSVEVVIGILVCCIYFTVFVLLSECFSVKENMERKYPGFEYGNYVFWEGVFRPAWHDLDKSEGEETDFILMFRWEYDKLLNSMKETLNFRIDDLIEQGMISDYQLDEKAMTVRLTVKACVDETEKEKFCTIQEEINDICSLCYIFTYKELPEESKVGITLCDEDGNQVQEISILPQEEMKKNEIGKAQRAYFQDEVELLKQLLLRSNKKTSFDFILENKMRGGSDNGKGGHIEYLDLSDYSDITGKLDLSGFTELRYVALKGMKIDSVILPDSLTSIEPDTFDDCKNLTEITIPGSVDDFTNPVFSGCKNLKEIIFEGNAPEVLWDKEDVFGDVPQDLIIYRKKSAKGWQETVWDKYDVRIIDE